MPMPINSNNDNIDIDGDVRKISKKSWFLICNSTLKGDTAYRDKYNGSIFIQYFCRNLEKEGRYKSLQDILTITRNDIQIRLQNEWTENGEKIEMVPVAMDALPKKIYLTHQN